MDEELADAVANVATDLRAADEVVALTGAGISAPSGVPTFRGEGGVWEEVFDPEDFRLGRFEANPAGFWADRVELHDVMYPGEVEPNAAHEALADLETVGHLDAVLTQNTDGLHQRAGSGTVVELHGNAHEVECTRCGHVTDAAPARERVRRAVDSDGERGENPPTCERCGGHLKPAVVLFGETLDRNRLRRARDLAADCDLLLAAGTSLTVDPAASLARETDGSLVIVNLDRTRFDGLADYVFRVDVTEVLPAIRDRVVE